MCVGGCDGRCQGMRMKIGEEACVREMVVCRASDQRGRSWPGVHRQSSHWARVIGRYKRRGWGLAGSVREKLHVAWACWASQDWCAWVVNRSWGLSGLVGIWTWQCGNGPWAC